MGVFDRTDHLADAGHEQVVFCQDRGQRPAGHHRRSTPPRSGPRSAGRASTRTPARTTALGDVLKLSRAMAYKAACAGLDLGGGKAVILGDPARRQDRGAAARVRPLRAVAGRPLLHRLRRRHLRRRTWTSSPRRPASSPAARPSRAAPATARCSRRTASSRPCAPPPSTPGARRRWPVAGSASRASARSGATSSITCSRTAPRSWSATWTPATLARLVRASTRRSRCSTSTPCPPRDLDVYAPCALGGSLDRRARADALQAAVVCGAANNQLAHPGVEKALADRGVLYTPDYVANAGGLVQVADEALHAGSGGFRFDRAKARAAAIFDTTLAVLRSRGRARACRRRSPPTGSPSAGWPTSAACAACRLPGVTGTPGRSAARGVAAPPSLYRGGEDAVHGACERGPFRDRRSTRLFHRSTARGSHAPTSRGGRAMGRGRAKAKQTKVARELKYSSGRASTSTG